jgi:hypothetical protein
MFRRNMLPPSSYYIKRRTDPIILLATCFLAGLFLALFFGPELKIKAVSSSETSVDVQRTTRRYIPGHRTLHNHRCENLKSSSLFNLCTYLCLFGARGSVVGWGTTLQAGWSLVRIPIKSLDFFIWPNFSSRTMAMGSAHPLTEMSIRNIPGGKGRPARVADNLTAICGPIV